MGSERWWSFFLNSLAITFALIFGFHDEQMRSNIVFESVNRTPEQVRHWMKFGWQVLSWNLKCFALFSCGNINSLPTTAINKQQQKENIKKIVQFTCMTEGKEEDWLVNLRV